MDAPPTPTSNPARPSAWTALVVLVGGGLLLAGTRGIDQALLRSLYVGATETLVRTAVILTTFGDAVVLTSLAFAAIVYLVALGSLRRAVLLAVVVLGGRAAVALTKVAVARERPRIDPHLVVTHTMSFPSGHSANTLITGLAIALLVPIRGRHRTWGIVLAIALSLAVGWSRVALGVHWPSDVVGGWVLALVWTMLCVSAMAGHASYREPKNAQ